eukprot:392449_1
MWRRLHSMEIRPGNKLIKHGNNLTDFISRFPSMNNFIIPMISSLNEDELFNNNMNTKIMDTISQICMQSNITLKTSCITPCIALRRFSDIQLIHQFITNCQTQLLESKEKYSAQFNEIDSLLIVGGDTVLSSMDYKTFFESGIVSELNVNKIYFGGYPEICKESHSIQSLLEKIKYATQAGIKDINIITQLCLDVGIIHAFCNEMNQIQDINSVTIGIPYCKKKHLLKFCELCGVGNVSMDCASNISMTDDNCSEMNEYVYME